MSTISARVEHLMQGTEYGDDGLRASMAAELNAKLIESERENRPLRVYAGFDPTAADLHLGHTVPIRKLAQFQQLGHEVTFLIGSFTSQIGDPSDKNKLRPILSREQIEVNARTYADQAMRILDRDKTTIVFNDEWLAERTIAEFVSLASSFTVQQFMARENFRRRADSGDPVYLHELFYGILQGIDATELRADVQVGGTDQLFNIVTASRKVMEANGQKPNVAIIMGILPGTDGRVKMSKSIGNHIPILASADEMYGKVMSLPDDAMRTYFEKITPLAPPEIDAVFAELEAGRAHPKDVKMRLAREVVATLHAEDAVAAAEASFIRTFQRGELPEDMPALTVPAGRRFTEVLVSAGFVSSLSEARRLIEQGGVHFEGETVTETDATVRGPGVLRAGKRRFLRVEIR
ncbi:MAG: tyrosine--tRNA ligase [Spirochaetaceae bacterium]|nr:MAG: tyrosine--tRNA ligase [Spirochaetaceae bacterium]